MAYTGPTLTWSMSAITVPSTPADPATVLTAISASVTSTSTWEVRSTGSNWLQLGTVAGSATPNQRVMVIHGATTNTCRTPDQYHADMLYIGIAPDGGTLIADPTGSSTTTANMYGSDRFSGCWKITKNVDANAVFTISSAEAIGIFIQNASLDDWYGGVAGAIIQPPDDLDGEGTPGRVYGMFVSGAEKIKTTFWTSTIEFTSHDTSNGEPHFGVFRPAATASFYDVDRADMGGTEAVPHLKTVGGTEVSLPVPVYESATYGSYFLGFFRQMQKLQEHSCRDIIQNGSSVDQVYCVGGDSNIVVNALGFTQS